LESIHDSQHSEQDDQEKGSGTDEIMDQEASPTVLRVMKKGTEQEKEGPR
jgi:hypothetical protein